MKVVIVGGGISGLAAAFRLKQAGCEVVVLEAGPVAGGKIRTELVDGYMVEHGPNGFLDSRPAMVKLARDVGLSLVPAKPAAERRFLFLRGALRALPTGPSDFLRSNLLSVKGRARMCMEPLIPRRRSEDDESVYEFAKRRVGTEAADTLIDPMVAGVFAGDPKRLSLPAAFPRLRTLERDHGGLVRGMLATRKTSTGGPSGPGGRLTSFEGGLQELVDALCAHLDGAVKVDHPVDGLTRDGAQWVVSVPDAEPIVADAVVLATPTDVMANLIGPHAPGAIAPLEGVPYAPAAVVALGFDAEALPRPLDGFGFLVPTSEGRRVLGVLYTSTIFADRAPEGRVLLRVIVGGARSPELLDLDDAGLLEVVQAELNVTLGVDMPTPVFHRVVRWARGIPQYNLGHLERRAQVEAAIQPLDGLHLVGNGLYGVSMAECAARADALVAEVLSTD